MLTRTAVREYLLDYERERVAVHRHKIVITGPLTTAIVALIVAIALPKLLIVAGIAWIWAGWRVIEWYATWFVLTNKRVIYAWGVFSHDIAQTSLSKVTDMKLHQSWIGGRLGWWKFIIETAGQDQALSSINFMPYPLALYQEITNQVFSDSRNEEIRGYTDQPEEAGE